ncbi:hypothetical protein DEO72_LG2g3631 [Vigna unguiculata]|uniref:Uncharacterized protein n=1 Tax=Vigna unguiculata TaxID=3917 RepID=A0A4D6L434_VIGUN|nr:hypothetical protein DEO72_LG2g3631 [Vigna unguiculata]
MCGCIGYENATVVGKQWRDLLFSPKRDRLAQARLTGTYQGDTHELSLRRSALFLSEALSRSSERRSPKREGVKALGCRCNLAQARNLTFGRGVISLRRGRARLSECARISQGLCHGLA